MTVYTFTWACYNGNNWQTVDKLSAGSSIHKTKEEARDRLDQMIKDDIYIAIEGDDRYDNDEFESKHLQELRSEYVVYDCQGVIIMDYPNDLICEYMIHEVNI